MSYPAPYVARTEREQDIVDRASAAADIAAQFAAGHDRDGSFPTEGLNRLAANGYLGLTVPQLAGGLGASVAETVLGNLALGKGDASLALVVAMHLALLGRVRDADAWPAEMFAQVAREVANARTGVGALINSLASEPEMGSPSRGGLPATTAQRLAGGWRLRGRKTFSSGAPVLRWGVISAAAQVEDEAPYLSNFIVPLDSPGIQLEPSWDTFGMRATGSHTLVLDDVEVGLDAEVPRVTSMPGAIPHERGWSLTIAAVYLGVAEAARDFAVQFARQRQPTALQGQSIASLPHIRDRVGRMDGHLFAARAHLLAAARAWDAAPSIALEGALAAAKMTVSNASVAVAEEAMRLVGGSSLDRSLPLERHYRDVRAGLHHPPQDDAALALLARQALDLDVPEERR